MAESQDDKARSSVEANAARRASRDDQDVGAALRSVYQKTVEEHVPDEFLDLLGKLG